MGKRGEQLGKVAKSGKSGEKVGKSGEKLEQEASRPDSSAV